ncbi:MAG: restriction endonuclease subunit S [Opitutales bacterium]|nr:restriction endonuclease subunit S [Opitutales bacterium]
MIYNLSKFNKSWGTKRLNELGTFKRGQSKYRPRNDKKLFENGTYPLVQTGNIKSANLYVNQHSQMYNDFGLKQSKLWPEGTLCVTIAANIAETAILSYPMCFPDSVVGFNAFEDECSEIYMHYVFTYIRKTIQKRIRGSIQDNINIDYLMQLRFQIPKPADQQKIAKVLSTIDEKIELNNRINEELEALSKLIYDYWFVQFDFPISAEQAVSMGRPHLEGKPYKSSGGPMVYNPTLKREIPEGWLDGKLEDVAEITMGQSPPGSSYNDEGEGELFFQGSTDFGTVFPEVRQYTTKPTRYAKSGDVLLSVRAPVGTMNIAHRNCSIGRGLASLRSRKDRMSYFLSVMRQFEKYFERLNSSGTTFGAINRDELRFLKIILPDDAIIEHFESVTSEYPKLIHNNHSSTLQLTELRDWLLPMLMNGQVTVK